MDATPKWYRFLHFLLRISLWFFVPGTVLFLVLTIFAFVFHGISIDSIALSFVTVILGAFLVLDVYDRRRRCLVCGQPYEA